MNVAHISIFTCGSASSAKYWTTVFVERVHLFILGNGININKCSSRVILLWHQTGVLFWRDSVAVPVCKLITATLYFLRTNRLRLTFPYYVQKDGSAVTNPPPPQRYNVFFLLFLFFMFQPLNSLKICFVSTFVCAFLLIAIKWTNLSRLASPLIYFVLLNCWKLWLAILLSIYREWEKIKCICIAMGIVKIDVWI